MPEVMTGAQRASTQWIRVALITAMAALLALGGMTATAPTVDAAGIKVAIVVGPSHSATSNYIENAKKLASQARSYGATVVEVYSPNATWTKVKAAAAGANIFIYLGHGNGWPSPYGPFSKYTKDGLGLNSSAGNGHANVKYYGEYYVQRELDLAQHAVVILNRLCYASGNSEWGAGNPTRSVAKQRIDNFGAGFLRTGADAVFAEGIGSAGYILKGVIKGSPSMTMQQVFWSASNATRTYRFGFASERTPGMRAIADPYAPSRYYRSFIGIMSMTVGQVRAG